MEERGGVWISLDKPWISKDDHQKKNVTFWKSIASLGGPRMI